MKRSLVLGVDGLDHRFVQDNLDSLPTFEALTQDGAWGALRSTVPPLTAPAWTTATTGMNPGKTGITNFVTSDSDADEDHVVDATDVLSVRIWDAVDALGGESVVIGVPITYPVSSIDGAMISGLRAPALDSTSVHPPELIEEIPADYELFISYSDYGPNESQELLRKLYASTDAKFDLLERVLTGTIDCIPDRPELIYFVLSEADWIQHYFLRHPEHPKFERGERTVLEYFQHVDSRIEALMELAESRTVGILSDHGFGKRISKHVYVNEVLRREGLLHLSDSHRTVRSTVGRHIRSAARLPGFQRLKDMLPKSAKQRAIAMTKLSDEEIDWGRTSAVFRMIGNNIGGVDLYPDAFDGDASELEDRVVELLSSINASEGEVIDAVYRRDELYSGPAAQQAPQVLFLFAEEYSGTEQTGSSNIVQQIPEGGRPGVCHRPNGVYWLRGEDVRTGRRLDADILDFVPTLYHAMDVPLPEAIDGSILDVFADSSPALYREYAHKRPRERTVEGSEEIEERLRGLGYL